MELEPIDILLVDDRPENLISLEAVLKNPGYNLIMVESGDEALRYLLDHEPVLILMDVQMPLMNGFETATIIKKSERTRDIPIVFVTAVNTDERFVQQGYRGGAVDYLYKPVDPEILRAKVATFAEFHRKTERLLKAERAVREAESRTRDLKIRELEFKGLKREQTMQRRYRDLIGGITHGIVWSADPDSLAVMFVSPSAERVSAFGEDMWLQAPDFLVQHVHEGDRERFLAAGRAVARGDGDVSIEHRFLAGNGRTLWFQTGLRLEAATDGSRMELSGLSIDITRVKEAEDQAEFMSKASLLLSADLDLETLTVSIGNLVVPRLADWYSLRLLESNGGFSLVAQRSNGEDPRKEKAIQDFLLESVSDAKPDPDEGKHGRIKTRELIPATRGGAAAEFVSAMILPLISHGKIFGEMNLASVGPRAFGRPELDIAMDLARRIAVAMDNAALYKAAKEAIRMRDDFLSVASHELKTPLTPLKLQTQMLSRILKDGPTGDARSEKIVKMVDSSSFQISRLNKLIDELLDISRISAGQLSFQWSEFDFREMLKEIIDKYSMQALDSRCVLSFNVPEAIPVFWDRLRMEQVVVNLLTNAIKYGAGKPIEISAKLEGGEVSFGVSDQGIGIDEQDIQRIFGRFERAVSPARFSGLGLGLYIVSQILNSHRGTISVESAKGKGASFKVKLPARAGGINSMRA